MNRRLLMVAFHFPPIQGSSGVHRTLAFAKYLRDFGWEATVLTASPRAYASVREENVEMIPPHVRVVRAFALDTKRHLAVKGRYPWPLALPDRWLTWAFAATVRGLQLVRQERPAVLFTTYPIPSAHLAGYWISRLTRLPWVADFRDPMAEPDNPLGKPERRVYEWLESRVVQKATRVVVTTPGTKTFYEEKYPRRRNGPVVVIQNGFDEESALGASNSTGRPAGRRVLLLHSGIVYPRQRDPGNLFDALAEMRREGLVSPETLEVRLRASGYEREYGPIVEATGLSDLVRFEPPVGYQEAAREMASADGLLLMQSSVCNRQIPAKVYEYLAARRPILGLAAPEGDTGRLLLGLGIETVAPLESKAAVKDQLIRFLDLVRQGNCPLPGREQVRALSRRARTAELAALLENL